MTIVNTKVNTKVSTLTKLVQQGSLSNQFYYGVERLRAVSDPTFTTVIGKASDHLRLPAHQLIRPCSVNANRQVVKFLNPVDWTKNIDGTDSLLDGTDGNDIMLYNPGLYAIFGGTDPTYEYWIIGSRPFQYRGDNAIYIPAFVDCPDYATLADGVTRSVRNETAGYAGSGSGYTAGGLGYPRTAISRYNYEVYATAKGTGWQNLHYYDKMYDMCMMYIEFKTKNLKLHFGPGASNWASGNWNGYNGYNPVLKIFEAQLGLSADPAIVAKGHMSGVFSKSFEFEVGGVPVTYTTQFPVWRSKSRLWGNLWQWYSGIEEEVQSAGDGGKTTVYYQPDPSLHDINRSDASFAFKDSYINAGETIRSSEWVKGILPGTVIGKGTGGSETLHECSYNWHFIPESGTVRRGVFFGAALNSGSDCALGSANANGVPSTARTDCGCGFRANVAE